MTLLKSLCESDSIEMFVNMSEYLQENDYEFEEIISQVLTHLTNLERVTFKLLFSPISLSA
jgi:hypothetical protein